MMEREGADRMSFGKMFLRNDRGGRSGGQDTRSFQGKMKGRKGGKVFYPFPMVRLALLAAILPFFQVRAHIPSRLAMEKRRIRVLTASVLNQQRDYSQRWRPRFERFRSCWKVPVFFLAPMNVKSKKGRLRRDGLFLKGGSPMRTRTPKYGTRIRCVTDYTIGLCNGHLCGAGELKLNRLFFASFFSLKCVF